MSPGSMCSPCGFPRTWNKCVPRMTQRDEIGVVYRRAGEFALGVLGLPYSLRMGIRDAGAYPSSCLDVLGFLVAPCRCPRTPERVLVEDVSMFSGSMCSWWWYPRMWADCVPRMSERDGGRKSSIGMSSK